MDKYFEKITIPKLIGIYILMSILTFIWSEIIKWMFKGNVGVFNNNFYSIISKILVIGYIVYKLKKNGFSFRYYINDFKYKPKAKDSIIILILHGIVSVFSSISIAYLIYKFNPSITENMLNERVIGGVNTLYDNFYKFILLVILAPIFEEFIFRGVILNRLKLRWGSSIAIIISSMLFAILHVSLAFIGAFLFGIMMCIVYIKTKNIFITMFIHCINNFLCSFQIIKNSGADKVSKQELQEFILMGKPSTVIVLIAIVISIYYIFKNWPNKKIIKGEY